MAKYSRMCFALHLQRMALESALDTKSRNYSALKAKEKKSRMTKASKVDEEQVAIAVQSSLVKTVSSSCLNAVVASVGWHVHCSNIWLSHQPLGV